MKFSSKNYWEDRYKSGGFSGVGSRGDAARYKAGVVNDVLDEFKINTLLDFGCGDGYQAELINVDEYIGYDVSSSVIKKCKSKFENDVTKSFFEDKNQLPQKSECVLSMDVIFHLVEDDVFEDYMLELFTRAEKLVIIFSTNHISKTRTARHVRHRHITGWIANNVGSWRLIREEKSPLPNEISLSEFFVFVPQDMLG